MGREGLTAWISHLVVTEIVRTAIGRIDIRVRIALKMIATHILQTEDVLCCSRNAHDSSPTSLCHKPTSGVKIVRSEDEQQLIIHDLNAIASVDFSAMIRALDISLRAKSAHWLLAGLTRSTEQPIQKLLGRHIMHIEIAD